MQTKFKRIISCLLTAVCLLLSLAACGSSSGSNNNDNNSGDNADIGMVAGGVASDKNGNQADVPDGAIQIASAEDLLAFRDRVNGGEGDLSAVLTENIDVSSACGETEGDWLSIGYSGEGIVIYEGVFDGADHAISGLYSVNDDYTVMTGGNGLFQSIDPNGVIRNLTLTDLVLDTEHGGAIASRVEGRLENCNVGGTVIGLQVGGLVCDVGDTAVLTGCSFSGHVEGDVHAAGLVWQNYGRIEQCRNEADVYSIERSSIGDNTEGDAAGIVNLNNGEVIGCINFGNIFGSNAAGIASESKDLIEDCLNEGNVTGRDSAAGIVVKFTDKNIVINRCGNTGTISGGLAAAGIVGNSRSNVTNCFHKGVIYAGLVRVNEVLVAAGLDEFAFWETTLNQLNSSRAAGIACYGVGAINCYSQGNISVTSQKGICDAIGVLGLLNADNPMVANCYTNAELSADDNMWGIGGTGVMDSCYYSEDTSDIPNRHGDLAPIGASSFTDGTVTDALNEWVSSAGGDYSAWVQGASGPCFAWE